jgi:hypothetical protein
MDKVDPSKGRRAQPGRLPVVPSPATSLLGLQRTAGNRAVSSLVRVQREVDDAFVGKLAKEQKALEKWNSAGSGRSQGLIHVVDYAKARPAKAVNNAPTVTDDALWSTFSTGHPLSGQQLARAFNEILGVTGALDELVTGNTTEEKAKGFGEQMTAANQWVKTTEGTDKTRARWEQQDTTFEGDAYDEEATPHGLRVIKWGPKGNQYSTVMGGS